MNATAHPPHTTPATRTCSFCDLEVARADVHKDRYGRYSCRSCRNQGHHLKGWKRLSHRLWAMRHRDTRQLMPYMVMAALASMLLLFGVLDFFMGSTTP